MRDGKLKRKEVVIAMTWRVEGVESNERLAPNAAVTGAMALAAMHEEAYLCRRWRCAEFKRQEKIPR